MARLETRWLLMSILLDHLPSSLSSPGPPSFLSPPQCRIHCEAYDRVHCEWEPDPDPSTNYTLYWKSAEDNKSRQVKASNGKGSIDRHDISNHSELSVWIRSENHYGSATSNVTSFNKFDIMRWPVPTVNSSPSAEPGTLEIQWKSQCVSQHHSEGDCEARHRVHGDPGWPEGEGGLQDRYSIDSPLYRPYTLYEFKVRCSCEGLCSAMSDWSPIYQVESAEAAPLGQLDVWQDCGTSSPTSECVLMWKRLSRSQARGHILGYEVKLSYSDGREAVVNVSTNEPNDQLKCDAMQCHLVKGAIPLMGVSAVTVSAYNTCGATTPAYLAMPVPGTENAEVRRKLSLRLKMDFENLNVSWDPSSQLYVVYVVQYKEAGAEAGLPPSQGFDWLRVNGTQTKSVTLTGQFKKYTPYQVSLFTISKNSDIHHLSSAIGYALQGVPPKVSSFRVASIEATSVTLSWEPIPLFQRKGVILFYQIGEDSHKVHNVSGLQQLENSTFVWVLEPLRPAEDYEVWIRAVTEAGPGANTTTRFKTKDQEAYGSLMLLMLLVIVIPIILCVAGTYFILNRVKKDDCPLAFQCCFEKVPDPGNSQLFYHFKHQFNDSWSWICAPVPEPHPEISQVEVVEHQPQGNVPCLQGQTEGVVGSSQTDTEYDQREDAIRKQEWERPERRGGFRREEYSKMIDSDEEKVGGEEEEEEMDEYSNLSEDDEFCSGYEKHFMPTALEVLRV